MSVFNSHGYWSTLGRIRELELDRDNIFPDLSYPDGTPAIWVCGTRREAVRYLLLADEWEGVEDGSRPVTEEELDAVAEIRLGGTEVIVASDGDGGYLLLDLG